MKISNQMNWRYAVKEFDAEKSISEDKINELKKVFQLTPSSFGLQPFRLKIISERKLKDELLKFTYGQTQFCNASHILIVSVISQIDEPYIRKFFDLIKDDDPIQSKKSKGYQQFVVNYFSTMTVDEKKAWAINQAYLAMGVLISACSWEAIDSCPMEGFNKKGFDDILGLNEKGMESCLALPIGIRSSQDDRALESKIRFPFSELFDEAPQQI
ncbi:nitroreductase family protein [Maribacter dokdonensis]|uniref:nitroreductase family protein n=1 Tax=Maribacter dokdonensis TaxID=320912 RepID=UPI001C0A65B1|nr:nitroreductase family protein [Maribacter dokdonensis]MBU2902967.1 nitroreductase family protein [Maribacter dokdonensis]